MKYLKSIILLFVFLNSFYDFAQCETVKSLFENDLYASKELRDYASKADDPDKVFDAWHLLLEEKSLEKTNAKVLKEVEDNYQAIKNAGGYIKWKNATGAGKALDFATMDLPKTLQHVKFRDLSNLARRDIVGLHDAVEFYKLRITRAIGNRSFQFPIGKTLDEVEEIVILAERNHPTIPGVKTIEYRVPSTDGKFTQKINGVDVNKGYTTGGTKGVNTTEDYVKTIYDPIVWSDAKLEKVLKDALQDAANKNNGTVPYKFNGVTPEGYKIEGYFKDGKVSTFYFEVN
ncbi:CdiA family toxin C-terminal domain-containing protein [Flavobacterium covae]|uniref:CdiA family toxin C-terminal domain-containing protein n=1 Tax=Flavobacterium covae TaxID=2906076 RepID=UPI001FB6D7BA|nr:CdiA family toxin C-terminal domain-containing protein [Flavobacterium covae]MCJ1807270.1 CdiA family toxin C-terminal domain-containing protein [Flavobacterium covae]